MPEMCSYYSTFLLSFPSFLRNGHSPIAPQFYSSGTAKNLHLQLPSLLTVTMCMDYDWWDINTSYWWGWWGGSLHEAKLAGRSPLLFASCPFLPLALLPAIMCDGIRSYLLAFWIGIEGCATEKEKELKLLNDIMKSS